MYQYISQRSVTAANNKDGGRMISTTIRTAENYGYDLNDGSMAAVVRGVPVRRCNSWPLGWYHQL